MTQQDGALVLVVDDDPDIVSVVERWLKDAGHRVKAFSNAESFLETLPIHLPDAVLLDIDLPGLDGLTALETLSRRHRNVPVLMMTGSSGVDQVVQAMQCGAYDYLTKPFERTRLQTAVRNAVERLQLSTELSQLEGRPGNHHGYEGFVGDSPQIRKVFKQIERIAASDISVLIHGESGTGKELAARAIHDRSERRSGPFVAVNCAAIPESLQDSELFGHDRGAFTGAHQARAGRFERAHRGTLFLDEVAELSPTLQAKLLRVLQEQHFERVGGSRYIESDFRLLAATHRDLRRMVAQGTFREDLYFRLAVFELSIPPLRERQGDLDLLVPALLEEYSVPEAPPALEPATLTLLRSYAWPGNVRELSNVLKRTLLVADDGVIRPRDLPSQLLRGAPTVRDREPSAQPPIPEPEPSTPPAPDEPQASIPAAATDHSASRPTGDDGDCAPPPPSLNLQDLERWAIGQAMKRTEGNIAEMSRILGIGRTTLYRKLKSYEVG